MVQTRLLILLALAALSAAPVQAQISREQAQWRRRSSPGWTPEIGAAQTASDDKLLAYAQSPNSKLRLAAIKEIARRRLRRATPLLARTLATASDESAWKAALRLEAARALGQMGDPRALPALRRAAAERRHPVSHAAALSLVALGDRTCGPLLRALMKDDVFEKRSIVKALGQIRHREAVPALLGALRKERYNGMRAAAAEALGRIGERRAVPALIAALRDDFPDVRRQAALALASLGDRQAVPALLRAAREPSPQARNAFQEDQRARQAAADAARSLAARE